MLKNAEQSYILIVFIDRGMSDVVVRLGSLDLILVHSIFPDNINRSV